MERSLTQLTLPVIESPEDTFDNFCAGENQIVVNFLRENALAIKDSKHKDTQIVFLHSLQPTGKSHILHALTKLGQENNIGSICFDATVLIQMPTLILEGVENESIICIDNLETIESSKEWQIKIFDLINQLLESGNKMIVMASKQKPDDCNYVLPDLVSRLNWGIRFRLNHYNDDDKAKILLKHAQIRGLTLSLKTAKFLLQRVSRDLHQIIQILNQLDTSSLQDQRAITIPFVKQHLNL